MTVLPAMPSAAMLSARFFLRHAFGLKRTLKGGMADLVCTGDD